MNRIVCRRETGITTGCVVMATSPAGVSVQITSPSPAKVTNDLNAEMNFHQLSPIGGMVVEKAIVSVDT
jgi:hypothetical protein